MKKTFRAAALIMAFAVCAAVSGCGGEEVEEPIPSAEPQVTEEPIQETTVIITGAGDFTLATDTNMKDSETSFEAIAGENDYGYFLRNVKDIFSEDDVTVVNLECVLSDKGTRSDKTFAFRGSPDYVDILTKGSVEAVNTANNHSGDYGETAYNDMLNTLFEAGITAFGGDDAKIMEVNGKRIGLCGSNALNSSGQSEIIEAVKALRDEDCDLIIASVHWGTEKAEKPSEAQVELAHDIIDAGADLILGHHAHVIQGIEKYNGKYICYSLGNFCYGGNEHPYDTDTFVFRQTFTFDVDGNLLDDDNTEIYPVSVSSDEDINNYQPTPAEGDARESIKEKIIDRSEALGDDNDAALNFK